MKYLAIIATSCLGVIAVAVVFLVSQGSNQSVLTASEINELNSRILNLELKPNIPAPIEQPIIASSTPTSTPVIATTTPTSTKLK